MHQFYLANCRSRKHVVNCLLRKYEQCNNYDVDTVRLFPKNGRLLVANAGIITNGVRSMGRFAISRRLYPCYQERACVMLREIEGDSCDYLSGKPVRLLMQRLHFVVASLGLLLIQMRYSSDQRYSPFSRSLYYSNRCCAPNSCGSMLTECLHEFRKQRC